MIIKLFLPLLFLQKVFAYDYYILAIQNWCSTSSPFTYKIHGLWPNFFNNTYPENCLNIEYIEMPSLKNDLNEFWYDCNEEESNYLWKHEFLRHGTCVIEQTKITQLEFFNTTINLFKKYQPKENICLNLDLKKIDCDDNQKFKEKSI